jgi:hypothetical protein
LTITERGLLVIEIQIEGTWRESETTKKYWERRKTKELLRKLDSLFPAKAVNSVFSGPFAKEKE